MRRPNKDSFYTHGALLSFLGDQESIEGLYTTTTCFALDARSLVRLMRHADYSQANLGGTELN